MNLFVRSSLILTVISNSILFSQKVQASDGAEVFDINKGEIVPAIENSQSLQNQVKEWLSSACGIAGSFKIEPNNGIAIKAPLIPPYKIQNEFVNGTVTEVVMFISRSSFLLKSCLRKRKVAPRPLFLLVGVSGTIRKTKVLLPVWLEY